MRAKRGLSQSDLAALLNTIQSGVSRLEDPNNNSISLQTIVKLAVALDCNIEINLIPKEHPINGRLAINHLDGDPNNNDLANLRVVRPKDNKRELKGEDE